MNEPEIRTYRKQIGDGQIRMMHLHSHSDKLHRHGFFELVYILRGTAVHRLEQTTATLHQGDYFIIDTGTVHCYEEVDGLEIVNCLFLPEYIDRALENCPTLAALLSNQTMRFGVMLDVKAADRVFYDEDGSVGRLIRQMEQEYAERKTGHMELLRCLLTQVLVKAVRASEMKMPMIHPATTAAAEYLREHIDQPLSLEKLGDRCGYTSQYISSLFHRDMGMTLQSFLQHLRVEYACQLMEKGCCTTEAAALVGYGDIKHFARVFRKCRGITPKQYCKSLQKNVI